MPNKFLKSAQKQHFSSECPVAHVFLVTSPSLLQGYWGWYRAGVAACARHQGSTHSLHLSLGPIQAPVPFQPPPPQQIP